MRPWGSPFSASIAAAMAWPCLPLSTRSIRSSRKPQPAHEAGPVRRSFPLSHAFLLSTEFLPVAPCSGPCTLSPGDTTLGLLGDHPTIHQRSFFPTTPGPSPHACERESESD